MPRIALSYRRADSDAMTGRLFDRLVAHYGRQSVFRDIDDIPLGVDFRTHIQSVLNQSDIVLVVMGPRWTGGRSGQGRLENPADPVRIEVETALRMGMPVIPILVGRTGMPKVDQLPESLADLAYRNGTRVDTGQDFDVHVDRLIRAMDGMFETAKLRESPAIGSMSTDLPIASGSPLPRIAASAPARTGSVEPSLSAAAEGAAAPPTETGNPQEVAGATETNPVATSQSSAAEAAESPEQPPVAALFRDEPSKGTASAEDRSRAPSRTYSLGHLEFPVWARQQVSAGFDFGGKSDREIRKFLESKGYQIRWSYLKGTYIVTLPPD
jgi:hypothetical protein